MDTIIRVDSICKTFTAGKTPARALDNVNLRINKGEIFGIFGPNGSGKTTLIKVIATLIIPDKGNLTVAQFDSKKQACKIRNLIGYSSGDERGFYGRISVKQNLEFFGHLYNLSDGVLLNSIDFLSESLGLTSYLNTIYQQCSSGIKQRAALAKSLLHNPEILLIDEFTKSIDPFSVDSITQFLKALSKDRKITIVFSSHDLADIESMCTHAALLQEGKIISCGSISELTHNGTMPLKNILTENSAPKKG